MARAPIQPRPLAALALLIGLQGWALKAWPLGFRVLGALYGQDHRQDLFEVAGDPDLLRLARSTVALFKADKVAVQGDAAILRTESFGKLYRMVPSERFYDQPAGAFCSGVLVAPDTVLTAGHCITSQQDCLQTKFVFDFALVRKDHDPTRVPERSVYGCAELLFSEDMSANVRVIGRSAALRPAHGAPAGGETDFPGADWALVKLDRGVLDRQPLAIDPSPGVGAGDSLVVIGYPYGLPAKVAGNGKQRGVVSVGGFFKAELDIHHGNSGSPVFNARTKLIEGVVVRTHDSDFVIDVAGASGAGSCADIARAAAEPPKYRWNLVAAGGGAGVEATHSPRFASKVQAILVGLTPALFDGH